jgi:chemotaxis signal transduction protein
MPQSTPHVRVRVGCEHYALPVEHVLEIVELATVTAVPGSPAGVLGVHVLRGEVIAAADLATVLGLTSDQTPQRLVVAGSGDSRRAGLAVDEVVGVETLGPLSHEREGDCVPATARVDGTLVGVLDVCAVFDAIAAGQPS